MAPRSGVFAAGATGEPSLPAILTLFAAFVAIWALYFTITEAPMAIKHDMSEAYAWGQEFQLGYNQHPPFWAWICGLWFWIFPRADWAFAALSSLNAGVGLWGAWMLIGNFAEGQKRIAAWLLLLLTPLYTFYSHKYNANIIFLSIWPWALHYFIGSVKTRQLRHAIAFGVLVGVAMMSKYYALTLVATCFFAAVQRPYRNYLASPSPYVAATVAAVIFAPHVVWLVMHRAPPLQYLANLSGQGWNIVADYALDTLTGAIGMNIGPILVVAAVAWSSRGDRATEPTLHERGPGLGILATLALAPLAATIVSGVALRTRTTPEMTIGTFALLPLLVIELLAPRNIERLRLISARLAVALTVGALAVSPALALSRTYLSSSAMKVAPFQEVAAQATKLWRDQTPLPLAYVAGSDWYENAIAFYSPDRPHVFVRFEYARNLWVTPELIAKHGLLSVCIKSDAICMAATAGFVTPRTTRTELTLAHHFWGHASGPVDFVVTIIPPRA